MPRPLGWLQVLWAALTSGSTQAFYDRIASVYDTLFARHKVHADVMIAVLRRHMPHPDDGVVIDLACGTGFLTARLVEEGYKPIGIDFSGPSLQFLQERLPQVPVVQADANRLPLSSESVSAVLCLGSWRHFSDPDAVASEIARVLEPGGLTIISYFPPAFGGVLQMRNSWLRRWMEKAYDCLVKFAGFSDTTSSLLEGEATEILHGYFQDVVCIPSGRDCTALLARLPVVG